MALWVTPGAEMQLAASLLLVFYLAALAVLLPRELRFLATVEAPWKRLFTVQDLLIQLAVLAVLLPAVLTPKLALPGFIVIMAGFVAMWGAALWAGVSRYVYTYRILLGAQRDAIRGAPRQSRTDEEDQGD